MAVVLGLAAALGFGGGDFLGGHASRRSPTLVVLLVVQAVGLLVAAVIVIVDGAPLPDGATVAQGAGAGLTGATGLGLLYRGLAVGRMGVVAPVSAVVASTLPVAWGLGQGERPSAVAAGGILLAVFAVALVARTPHDDDSVDPTGRRSLAFGIAAGLGFGMAVVLFAESGRSGAFWPLVLARAAAIPMLALALGVTRRTGTIPAATIHPGDRRTTVGSGLLDVTGNAALVAGFRAGLTSLVAPIAALYPGTTVLLARVVLHEHLGRLQSLGLLLALVALVLIAAG